MAYHNKITLEELENNLKNRILENQAEVKALRGVSINTSHKTLNNRSVTGEGVRIGDYIGINKALFVSYAVEWPDNRRKYETTTITAYSYEDENGVSLRSVPGSYTRTSRTITPEELRKVVNGVIEARIETIKELKKELKRSRTIVKQQNSLVDKLKAFNDSVSYASQAQI